MNVAFIPVRGGSKSIPLKNIKLIAGKPLVYWTIKAAIECKYIDKIYVATDSDKIKNTVQDMKDELCKENRIEIISRSAESATDNASTEFVMMEFSQCFDFDNIVLIQATSPLLTGDDLNRGFEIYQQSGVDSVLSAVRQKRFNWEVNEFGIASALNYDIFNRPRRQEFNGYFVENGAFYITSKRRLENTKNRISGTIKICEMSEETFLEIDEPSDWNTIEKLLVKRNKSNINNKKIKMFLTDCDGCLTDGGMYYSENGDELKKFNTKDGMAFSILKEKGIITGIVTGEKVELNKRRADKLDVDICELGCVDKKKKLIEICDKYKIEPYNVLYIGDDINDIDVMKMVGISCCPADAVEEVKKYATFIANTKGGAGVVREVVEEFKMML